MNRSHETVTGERVPGLEQVEYHIELLERELRTLSEWARGRAAELVAIVQDCEAELEEEWGGSASAKLSNAAYEARSLIRLLVRGQLGLVNPGDPRYRHVRSQLGKVDTYERRDAPWRSAA